MHHNKQLEKTGRVLGVALREARAGAAQGSHRGGNFGEAPNELTVVISEAAHVRARRGRDPLRQRGDLAGFDGDAALRDDVVEEALRGAAELALGRLGVAPVVPKGFKHQSHSYMRQVLLAGLGEDGGPAAETRPEASKTREGRPKMRRMYVAHV